jgi:hypothetical protein
MKSYSIIIGISLLLTSCSVKQDVVGKYMSKNNPNYLQLRKDGMFIYEYRALHFYQQSIGQWTKDNSSFITLNSPIRSTVIPITVMDRSNTTSNTVTIKLTINDSKALADYKCRLYINDAIYCTKRCDSLSLIPVNLPIENMYFMFIKEPQELTNTYLSLPLTTEKYSTKPTKGNAFEVNVVFSDIYFYYKAFNNDTLRIKNNGIQLFNSNKGKWEKLLKVSNTTNLFSRYNDQSTELNLLR